MTSGSAIDPARPQPLHGAEGIDRAMESDELKVQAGAAQRCNGRATVGPGSADDRRPLLLVAETAAGVVAALAETDGADDSEYRAAGLALYELGKGLRASAGSADMATALGRAMAGAEDPIGRVAARERAALGVSLLLAGLGADGLHWIAAGEGHLYCLRDGQLIALWPGPADAPRGPDRAPLDPAAPTQGTATGQRRSAGSPGRGAMPRHGRSSGPIPLRPGDRLLLCSRTVAEALGSERIAATLRFDPQPAADELVALTAGHSAVGGDARAIVLRLVPARRSDTSGPRRMAPGGDPTAPHLATADRGLGHRRNRVVLATLALTLRAVIVAAAALLPHWVRQGAPPPPDPAIGADSRRAAHPGTMPDAVAGARTAEPVAVAPPAEPPARRPEAPAPSPASAPASAPSQSQPTPALSLPRPLQYRDLPTVGR